MGIGSGLGAQMVIGAESAYGTYIAPGHAIEFTKESLVARKVTAQSAGIAAGRLLDLGSRRVMTTTDAGGSFDIEVVQNAMGLIFQALMGSTVVPVQNDDTDAYTQTHTLADTAGKSLVIQKGVPLTTGTVTDKTFLGCKILSAEFSCEVGGMLMATIEIDAKACDETQTLVVAAYTPTSPFHFGQMALKAGEFGSEAALDGVRKVSIKIERKQAVDRYYAGQNGKKKEPITNDKVAISGSVEYDYVATTLDDLFTTDGPTSLVWEFTGPLIDTGEPSVFQINLPEIRVDGTPPSVDGPAVVKPTSTFTGLYDGTHQPSLVYVSSDTTL